MAAAKKKKKEAPVVETVEEDDSLMDFTEFDYDELFVLQDQLAAHIEERKSQHLDDVRAKMEALAEASHMSIEELQALLGQKKKKPPKYRNPDNANLTWVGSGRKPSWLQKLMEDGHNIDEFLIKKAKT